METLMEKLLNLLGYYNLTPDQYFAYYGYDYYIPTRTQLFNQINLTDEVLADVIGADIAVLIQAQIANPYIPQYGNDGSYQANYDFAPFFAANSTDSYQQRRVTDLVLDELEKGGYRVSRTYGATAPTQYTFKWKFAKYRMFKKIRPNLGGGFFDGFV